MEINPDITEILKSWPYDPENDARIIRAADGREVIQVRTPLGIEQMEIDGRPDGLRPNGMESSFDYCLLQLEQAKREGREDEFELNHQQCIELFNEATLYYFRYLRLFQLRRWELVVRDTNRNLKVFDFVKRYASDENDRWYLEKWRPYILRINGVSRAMLMLESGDPDAAIHIVSDTLTRVRSLPPLEDETFEFEQKRSILALEELLSHLHQTFGRTELERLEEELRKAIEEQAFERAAELRDRIRALKAQQQNPPPTG